MNKLIRKYYYISDTYNTFPNSHVSLIARDLKKYFDTTPEGKTYKWANGTITRTRSGAIYRDSKGQEININPNTNIKWLMKNKDIYDQWMTIYADKEPLHSYVPVTLGSVVTRDLSKVSAVIDTNYVDASQCEYKDLVYQYIQTFEWLATEVAFRVANRPCSKLTYLDASSRTGICENHSTHNGYPPSCIDIQYYTKGETNYTQRGNPRINIWTNGKLNDLFDAERMALLVVLMAEAFPCLTNSNSAQVLAWPDIKRAMMNVYNPGSEEYKIINEVVQADNTPAYNHNRHMHVYLLGEVNYDMIV